MADIQRAVILYLANEVKSMQDASKERVSLRKQASVLQNIVRSTGIWDVWTRKNLYTFNINEYDADHFDCILIEQFHKNAYTADVPDAGAEPSINVRCIELVEQWQRSGNRAPIIVLSDEYSDDFVHQLKQGQVSHFIYKDSEEYYLQQFTAVIQSLLRSDPLNDRFENEPLREQRLNRNLLLLNQVGQMLTSTLEPRKIAAQLVETVVRLINTEGSTVWLFSSTAERYLVCQAAYSSGQHVPAGQLRLSPGEGIAGWVAEHGETVVVTDVVEDARFSARVDSTLQFQTRSLLTVPLRAHNESIGVLQLVNKKQGTFDQDDCILAETLASSTAIAMENTRLIETLRQRNAELEQRNMDLDAYSDTVAHDLKNPITHFLSYADDLNENYDVMSHAEIENHLNVILQQSRRMSNIIDELLLLARVRTVEELELYPLDMAFILEVVEHRVRAEIQEVNIQLSDPESWPNALGYAPWIEGVWYNYISNGLKYGGDPPEIVVGGHAADDGMAHFWVHDNGSGLEPEEIEKLFEPFPKLEHKRKKGHGLGLVIVKRIVERLGGSSWVHSKPGEGSTFYFSLPQA